MRKLSLILATALVIGLPSLSFAATDVGEYDFQTQLRDPITEKEMTVSILDDDPLDLKGFNVQSKGISSISVSEPQWTALNFSPRPFSVVISTHPRNQGWYRGAWWTVR